MSYLASPYFDSKSMMGTLPISHYVTEALNNHISGKEKIVKAPIDSVPPLHVNFL
jgi:hypothetical protein